MYNRAKIRSNITRILKTQCVGKANGIKAVELFCAATGDYIIPAKKYNQTRILRTIIRELRTKKIPICAGSSGYYLAADEAELEEFIKKNLGEAARRFQLARSLSKVPISKMVRQYDFNFTDNEENSNDNTN